MYKPARQTMPATFKTFCQSIVSPPSGTAWSSERNEWHMAHLERETSDIRRVRRHWHLGGNRAQITAESGRHIASLSPNPLARLGWNPDQSRLVRPKNIWTTKLETFHGCKKLGDLSINGPWNLEHAQKWFYTVWFVVKCFCVKGFRAQNGAHQPACRPMLQKKKQYWFGMLCIAQRL